MTLDPKTFDVIVRPVDDQGASRQAAENPRSPRAHFARRAADDDRVQAGRSGVAAGRHYWVEIWGLKATGGAVYPLQYLVDFITVHPEDGSVLALDGVPTYPRTLDDLRRGLETMNNAVPAPFDAAAAGGRNLLDQMPPPVQCRRQREDRSGRQCRMPSPPSAG